MISKQTKQFYHCITCDVEMSEEKALMNDFTCSECGEVFESKDNRGTVTDIEKKLENLNSKLAKLLTFFPVSDPFSETEYIDGQAPDNFLSEFYH